MTEQKITTAQIKTKYEPIKLQRAKLMLMALSLIQGPTKKRGRTYNVLGDLPASGSDLRAMYIRKFQTHSVADAYNDAMSEIGALAEEMGEWRDNMDCSEGLSATAKYDEVSEAADILDNAHSELETYDGLEDVLPDDENIWVAEPWDIRLLTGWNRNLSRQKRLENALAGLSAVVEWLTDEQDLFLDATEYISTLDFLGDNADELGCVEFPGMY